MPEGLKQPDPLCQIPFAPANGICFFNSMQQSLFRENELERLLIDLFKAYFDARKNKRNTLNALAFEKHLEENVFELFYQITANTYQPLASICFIVDKPVKREIFAAAFRDRVIHHLIFNYISPVFEKTFINDCYSCRKAKGTHYGIQRMDHFMRSCSANYSRDCYILKLDISGYFMSMNKSLLFQMLNETLMKSSGKIDFDIALILKLISLTIFNDPTENCIIKGNQSDWDGLPKSKSLFHAKKNCGLPIGNLTSQLFGNIYLSEFDHWVKRELKIKCYGRYVDDFILMHESKEHLKSAIPKIRNFLREKLLIELHPAKIYLQHYSRGVAFLGAVIKPHRIYIGNRTKGNFHGAITQMNKIAQQRNPSEEEKTKFRSSMNSYLGIMRHYKTYRLRKNRVREKIERRWWTNFKVANNRFLKISLRQP